jgi:tRNA(fMet)-specific endonuclease VapC
MSQIALDTNAYGALARGDAVVSRHVRSATDIGIPVTVLGEINFGIFDGQRSSDNGQVLDRFLSGARVQTLPVDETTAQIFGEIATELKRLGKPIQQNDLWIAAACKQHGYGLVTNDQGFQHIIGLQVNSY